MKSVKGYHNSRGGDDTPIATDDDIFAAFSAPRSAFQDALKRQFGKNLRREILLRGWTQSEFARRCDLPRDSISTYVLGKALPSPTSAKAITDVLGVSLSDLVGGASTAASKAGKPGTLVLDIYVLPDQPGQARLRVDRVVRVTSALKIAEILESDSETADRS